MNRSKINVIHFCRRLMALGLAYVFALAGPAGGQDFERIAPKLPAPSEGRIEQAPGPVAPEGDNTRILVGELKGLVFVDAPDRVNPQGLSGVTGIRAEGIALLESPAFSQRMEPYLGRPVTLLLLNTMVRDVVIYYRENNRPVVDVIVPEQEITTGVVQLLVLEGRLGEVRAEGNEWFNSGFLAGQVRMKPGDLFDEQKLQDDLAWLNGNPFRDVNLIYTPGRELALADLVVQTQDRFPVRFFGGYEDSGNDLTDDSRYFAGFNWGDAFFLDHQMNYQFTINPDGKKFKAHSGSYIIPLPWRHTWTFFGSYVDTKADVPPPFSLEGISWQASTRYLVPLPDFGPYRHEWVGGYDFKQTNNNLEFGGITVVATPTEIVQWVVGYNGSLQDDWGTTTGGLETFVSPGGWTDKNRTVNFQTLRAFSSDEYVYSIASLDRLTRLPEDFTLSTRFKYQFANANLLPSEQFGLGGYQTVRGYDEREANGDEGYLVSVEIRTPPVSIFAGEIPDQLQFLVFWDYGSTYNRTLLPGEDPNILLSGVGPGIRYVINPYLSFRFDYGFQLYQAVATRHGSRGHLGAVLSY